VSNVDRDNIRFVSGNSNSNNFNNNVDNDINDINDINNINDINDSFNNVPNDNNAFGGPEVRPDGRPPRVKSDILAKKKNQGGRFFNRHPVVTSTPAPFHLIPRDPSTPAPPPPFVSQTQAPPQSFPEDAPSGPSTLSPFIAATRRPPQSFSHSTTLSPFIAATQRPVTQRPPQSQFSPRPPPTLIPPFRPNQSTRRPVTLIPPFSSTPHPIHPAATGRPVTPEPDFFDDGNFVSTTQFPIDLPGEEEEEENELSFGTERPTFNAGFRPQTNTRRPGTRPRVKSDILIKQRNRGRGESRFIGHNNFRNNNNNFSSNNNNRFRNNNNSRRRRPLRPAVTTTAAPFDNGEVPEFIDEIDEIEERPRSSFAAQTQRPETSEQALLNQLVTPRSKPKVKSDILAARKNNNRIRGRQRNRVQHQQQQFNFVSNSNSFADDSGECSNPFKCPPKSVADGRRPRVKSNIRARNRNFHNPLGGRTDGRIGGRGREQHQQAFNDRGRAEDEKAAKVRQELDDLLAQLKERRQGKAIDRRVKPEESSINSGAHSTHVADGVRSATTARPDFDGTAFFSAGPTVSTTRRPNLITTAKANDAEYEYEYYYADEFEESTTAAPFIFTTTTTTPSPTTAGRTGRPSPSSGFFDSSTHRPFISSTRRPSSFSSTIVPAVSTTRPPFVSSTLLPVSQAQGAISTTRRPRTFNNGNDNRRPAGFPTREELEAHVRGDINLPGFSKPKVRPFIGGGGNRPTKPTLTGSRTRFPPRGRPTPATSPSPPVVPVEENEVFVTQAPPVTPTQRTTRQPVTLPLGVASSAVLDPKLPPIPTLPPDAPVPAEHVSFLEKNAGRDGNRRRPGQQNNNNNGGGRRQPRVKSDLQQQQINRWSRKRKDDKKHARQNKSFDRSLVNFVTTAQPKQFSLAENENDILDQEDNFNEIDDVSATTFRPPISTTGRPPLQAGPTRIAGKRRRLPFGVAHANHRRPSSPTRRPPFRSTVRTTRSPKFEDSVAVENSFATGIANQPTEATPTREEEDIANDIFEEEEEEKETSEEEEEEEENARVVNSNFNVRPDGRRPRVKSDIQARLKNQGKHFRNNQGRRRKQPVRVGLPESLTDDEEEPRRGKAVDLSDGGNEINPDDDQPKVRPDGQKPRVKSDLLARQGGGGGSRHQGRRRKNRFRHSKRVNTDGQVKFVFEPTPAPTQSTSGADSESEGAFFTINTRAESTTTPSTRLGEEEDDEGINEIGGQPSALV
jgi:hypothetical protein